MENTINFNLSNNTSTENGTAVLARYEAAQIENRDFEVIDAVATGTETENLTEKRQDPEPVYLSPCNCEKLI